MSPVPPLVAAARAVPPSRWEVRAAHAGGVVLAALWLLRFAPGIDHAVMARVCAAAMVPIAVAFGALLWRRARAPEPDPRLRRAWRWIAIAVSAWWVAGVVWELLGRPQLSAADVVQLAFFPAILAGVLAFPARPAARNARLRFWLDTGVVVLSGAAAVWYFVVWPSFSRHGVAPVGLLVNAAYLMGDLGLLFAACAALVRRPEPGQRRVLAWVAAGLLARFAGDLSSGWEIVTASYIPGGVTDLTWLTGVWLFAMGSVATAPEAGAAARPGDEEASADGGLGLLPYASVAALYGFLLVSAASAWGTRVAGVLLSAVTVTALVLARQYVASRELLRLQRERGARDAVRATEARFRSFVQHSSDVIVLLDAEGTIRYVSPSVTRALGHEPDALLGRPLVSLVHDEDLEVAGTAVAKALASVGFSGPAVVRVGNARGEWRTMECVATNLVADPAVGGIVVNARDVTERATLQEQLLHQAYHDPLTGLANRALFRDRVAQALARLGRQRQSVSVLFLDLDDFKTVNDSLGHAAGDRLLSAVAERLLNATRGCDTVARLGGDEFAVLIEHGLADEDALVVAERIARALRAPVALDATELAAGVSIGLARARPQDGPEELLRNADVAMYRAKTAGKGRTEVFAPEMHAALVDRLALEGDLRRAVAERAPQAFAVHYQPIVRLEDAAVVGVEALVRWTHPTRGRLSPATFIPIAESSGLIVPLGAWVLREACRAAARWSSAGRAPLTLTVNLSGRQLQAPGLVQTVATALAESGFPAGALVLEITETVIMQQTEATLVTLHALKALGVRLAIDDFGTGYSSLAYLQRFPIDILKIDKSFVDGLGGAGSDAALARTIIALGSSLALRCVAEGVEREEQRAQLRALGCEYAQGFLFARPMPAEELSALVAGVSGGGLPAAA